MNLFRVTLPIATVSEANRRDHWSTRARRAKMQRWTVAAKLHGEKLPKLPVVVTLTRLAPRELDTDNLAGAMKAIRDGVADAYGLKSDRDARVTWRYAQERADQWHAGVRIAIQG